MAYDSDDDLAVSVAYTTLYEMMEQTAGKPSARSTTTAILRVRAGHWGGECSHCGADWRRRQQGQMEAYKWQPLRKVFEMAVNQAEGGARACVRTVAF